jgi:hypothetical protein
MMVPPARIDELNMMGGPRVADYGVVAVDVVSVSGACDPTGGTVSINPAPLGRVFYGKADQSLPDSTTMTMQAGARPSAWVLGVLPPGAYYQLKFVKAGCTPRALPAAYSGRSYSGDLPIQAKALSHALLLVD